MKREIKFKSYVRNKETGEIKSYIWLPFPSDDYEGEGGKMLSSKHEIVAYGLQFTGLHDKNGKEIYEGDILKLQYPINYGFGGTHNKEITVTISFDNGSFWFAGEGYTDCNWHFYNKYEVIGNIYENPELLNT